MIQYMPYEIINQICQNLSQSDSFHLSLCSKHLYQSSIPRLYQSIIIDSAKKDYELFDKCNQQKTGHANASVIHTFYGFKLLLKTLSTNPVYCSHIKLIFVGERHPSVPDHVLDAHLNIIFPQLVNIADISWCSLSHFLSFRLVASLPNWSNLTYLEGNFRDFARFGHSNSPKSSLKKLALSCFNKSEILSLITLDNFPMLRDLKISKKVASTWPSNESSVSSTLDDSEYYNKSSELFDEANTSFHEANYIKNLLASVADQSILLSSLCLDNLFISTGDAELISTKINLSKLTTLSLINCCESISDLPANSNSNDIRNRVYFLQNISPFLLNIETLNIDFYNDFKDSTPKFITTLPKLTKLYVQIRWSKSRAANFLNHNNGINFDHLLAMYFESFLAHRNQLTTLLLDIKFEDSSLQHSSRNEPTIPMKYLKKLSQMKMLTKLRIPNVNEFDIPLLLEVLSTLTNLEMLDLVLPTKCHLGTLLSLFSSIPTYSAYYQLNDEFGVEPESTVPVQSDKEARADDSELISIELRTFDYKIMQYQNYVKDFKKLSPRLRFLRIGDKVFRCDNEVCVRCGLNEWFDEEMKK